MVRSVRRVDTSDQHGIVDAHRRLFDGDILAFGVVNAPTNPRLNSRTKTDRHGHMHLGLPWLDRVPFSFRPFGSTEVLDSGTGQDQVKPAHRDMRPADVINIHFTCMGSGVARFAELPEYLFDSELELDSSLSEYVDRYDVEESRLSPGLALCFLGGVVAHEFVSLTEERVSAVQSFTVTGL